MDACAEIPRQRNTEADEYGNESVVKNNEETDSDESSMDNEHDEPYNGCLFEVLCKSLKEFPGNSNILVMKDLIDYVLHRADGCTDSKDRNAAYENQQVDPNEICCSAEKLHQRTVISE